MSRRVDRIVKCCSVFRGKVEHVKERNQHNQPNNQGTRDDFSVEATGHLSNANRFLLAIAVGSQEVSKLLQDLQRSIAADSLKYEADGPM